METATLCHRAGLLARNGCFHDETSYTATLPRTLIPKVLCNQHDSYRIGADFQSNPASLPERTRRSIGKFFRGGD